MQVSADRLTRTRTLTVDLLNPKSVGCDSVLRTIIVPSAKSFRSWVFVVHTSPLDIHTRTSSTHTLIHIYAHFKLIAISAPLYCVAVSIVNNDSKTSIRPAFAELRTCPSFVQVNSLERRRQKVEHCDGTCRSLSIVNTDFDKSSSKGQLSGLM